MGSSGQILDLYDDVQGTVLKQIYPTAEGVPEVVKTAHALSAEERSGLPDDVFALVLLEDGDKMRKFACTDPGNTELNISYFLKTAGILPFEAQQQVAANLVHACGWYDLTPPESLFKIAEVTGTALMPVGQRAEPPSKVTTIKKAEKTPAHFQPYVDASTFGPRPQVKGQPVAGRVVPSVPDKKPESQTKEVEELLHKKAYALGDRYPISSYADVEKAAQYFQEHWAKFDPTDRRDYCVKLAARADELCVELPLQVLRYAGTDPTDVTAAKLAHLSRMTVLSDSAERQLVTDLFDKKASVDPEIFAVALHEFDKLAGITHLYNTHVVDYVESSFASKTKTAEFLESIGNDHVNEEDLRRLAKGNLPLVEKTFGEDMAQEFAKKPVAIFKSLPLEQKKMIMRMATDNPGV